MSPASPTSRNSVKPRFLSPDPGLGREKEMFRVALQSHVTMDKINMEARRSESH